MHSTRHEESGITIHHNGDYSGDFIFVLPSEPEMDFYPGNVEAGIPPYWTVKIPGEPIVALNRAAVVDEIISMLERI